MDEKRLAEIEAREQAARKGPWLAAETLADTPVVYFEHKTIKDAVTVLFEADWGENADAEFVAHARTDVADLVADQKKVRNRHRPVVKHLDYTDCLVEPGPDESTEIQVCMECDGIREQVNPDAAPILWADCNTMRDLAGDTTTETSEEAA